MRAWLLLLALGFLPALATAQADEGRMVEHGAWTQYEPRWREGPATIAFGERTADVPFGARYATDGATWLYAADEPAPERPGIPESCAEFPASGTWVLVSHEACTFAPHPGVACAGTHVCEDAQGLPRKVAAQAPPAAALTEEPEDSEKETPSPAALAVGALGLAWWLRRR